MLRYGAALESRQCSEPTTQGNGGLRLVQEESCDWVSLTLTLLLSALLNLNTPSSCLNALLPPPPPPSPPPLLPPSPPPPPPSPPPSPPPLLPPPPRRRL
ncbi:unnamed protein product [Closterium sp. NIES-64]|nr:unnamed protein product [Closterium sp. NIES-64]